MSEVEIRREIEALEARLALIEERLGIGAAAPPAPTRTEDVETMLARLRAGKEQITRTAHRTGEAAIQAGAPDVVGEAPPQRAPSPARDKITPSAVPPVDTAHQQDQPSRVPPTVPPISTPAAVSPRAGRVSTPDIHRERGGASISLEALIGGKWMAWVGALVIVIGAGFLAAYIDVGGLWGGLPEALKCGLLAAFGGALLAGGEWVMRRVGRIAAVGLFAAGLGTLYVAAYATAAWYDVLPEVGALGLLAIVALGGLALTARTGAQAIGVLSIAGGYLAPILMRGATTFPSALPLYLTALLAVALALSAVRPRPFRTLRYVALGAHALVGFFWVFGASGGEWASLIVFGGLWWVMITAEALVAALRRQSAKGNAIATFLATAWFVTIVSLLGFPSGEPAQWLGIFTASLAVLSGALALQFGTGLTALRDRPENPIDVMTATLWLQAGILVPMAIAFQFDGYAQTIGWLLIGLGGIEIGRRLRSRAVDVFGVVVGGLGVARLALLDWWILPGLGRELATVGSVTITGWSILALCAIAAVLLAGMRFREGGSGWKIIPAFLTGVAGFGWMVVTLLHSGMLTATAAWILGGAALIAAREYTGLGERQHCARFGIILIGAALAKWILFDTLGGIGFGRAAQPDWMVIINPQFGVAALLAAAAWRLARLRNVPLFGPEARAWAPVALVLIVLWGLSFEIDRIIALTPLDGSTVWPRSQLVTLLLCLLWGAGGLMMGVWGCRHAHGRLATAGGALLFGAGVLWLTGGTLVFRISDGVVSAMVIFNPQFVIGAALAAALAAHLALLRRTTKGEAPSDQAPPGFFSDRDVFIVWSILIGAIGLWLGSLEIDRLFAEAPMAKQTGFSIFWTVYGLGLIVLGFARNAAPVRYVGLGLLALTLVKVGLIDTAQLAGIYRPLSFIAVGLLLVATSIGYLKLTPRLLAMHDKME